MLEKIVLYDLGDEKKIEKLIWDENLHLNHVILTKGESLPLHYSNSNVYLILIRGIMSSILADEPLRKHQRGEILQIPDKTKMDISNQDEKPLEFFIVKALAPR